MDINTPTTISNISLVSTNTILEELSKNNIRTIEQISEDNKVENVINKLITHFLILTLGLKFTVILNVILQVGSFWVFAKIVGVESSNEWSYLSCKKCPKKVTPVGDKFYCESCDRFEVTGNLRFD